MPFPVIKLAFLAVKQASKPLAIWVKNRAVASHTFRKTFVIPTAQLFHFAETKTKSLAAGFGWPVGKISPLTEELALVQGAEIIGEFVLYSIAGTLLLIEYNVSSKKAQLKEETLYNRIDKLESGLEEAKLRTELLVAQLENSNKSPNPPSSATGLVQKLRQATIGKTEKEKEE